MERKYYEAYDDRYRQIHEMGLQWSHREASPIVMESICRYGLEKQHKMLELGCGEGRDALFLLERGYDLLATDISREAIDFCRERMPSQGERFQILDCVAGQLDGCFDFIYAVAVIHMLVEDSDRKAFLRFIRSHLAAEGKALICTMGDGNIELKSDIRTAFDLQDRFHEETGTPVKIAGTSCRMVSSEYFGKELEESGLVPVERGISTTVPGFNQMMYAVVKRK